VTHPRLPLVPTYAAVSLIFLCCSSNTSPIDVDAATGADATTATSGAGGTAGTMGGSGGGGGGAGGASGSTSGAGGDGATSGTGGATGGRGGSVDGGGDTGSSRGGQAGTSTGDADTARDARDGQSDAATPSDGDADSIVEAAADTFDARADARADSSVPPLDGTVCGPLPSAGVYATFRVVGDVFDASITNATGIDQAVALWRGQSQAKIPVGHLECNNGTYNCGWTWRMNPASITFAELTIEVCDATPSHVENHCGSFPNGQYCPWSAQLIALRDCRTDPSCPAVPR
jgi:hypothetical protein